MKPFTEQDLIAYHLRELSPRRARALERALRADPPLAVEFEAYAATFAAFSAEAPVVVDEEVLARNWRALQPSLPAFRPNLNAGSRWRLPATAGAGLALAAASVFFVARHHPPATPVQPFTALEAGNPPVSFAPAAATLTPEFPIVVEHKAASRQVEAANPRDRLAGESLQKPHDPIIEPRPLSTASATIPHLIPFAFASRTSPAFAAPSLPIVSPGSPLPLQTIDPGSHGKSKRERALSHHGYPADLTFALGGTLIGARNVSSSGTGTYSVGATHAVSAIAAYHQQFHPAIGYRVAFSYTRPDFQYGYSKTGTSGTDSEINGRLYELTGTYAVQGPHRGRLSTWAEAGAGLMVISPTQQSPETSHNLREAAVIGVASDYSLTKHLGLHLGYRAQVFKGPDFNYIGTDKPIVSTTLLSNEPVVGIIYRFHAK